MAERDALETALRALRARDRSARELDERLVARGFSAEERERALASLERTGLLDDVRFAEARARSLAARGAGDALIRHALNGAGIAADSVESALAGLEPEEERARRIVGRRGPGPRTARYLLAKGFARDVVEGVVAEGGEQELR
jgi:regulatory protein